MTLTSHIAQTIAALFHSLRRWAWQEFGPPEAGESQCIDCGRALTGDEVFYYVCTCERCEALAWPEDR